MTEANTKPQADGEIRGGMNYALIRHTDMKEEMRIEAVDTIVSSMEKFMQARQLDLAAKQIKETMDKKYSPNWSCVVGEGFGFEIVCEKNTMLYLFYGGTQAVLLFKNPF